jgi:hypothetical protein
MSSRATANIDPVVNLSDLAISWLRPLKPKSMGRQKYGRCYTLYLTEYLSHEIADEQSSRSCQKRTGK